MRKYVALSIALALAALLAMAGTAMAENNVATAAGKLTSTITWSFQHGTLSIQGSGATPDFVYPSSAAPEPPWDELRDDITQIVVGEGMSSLGNYIFRQCKNVVSVQLPSTLKTIGGGVFVADTALTQITIPDSVSKMSWDVFFDCTALEYVHLPSSLRSLSTHVFHNTQQLKSIYIPSSITEIASTAFHNHSEDLTIYGEANSYAQRYAKYNHIPFVVQTEAEFISAHSLLTDAFYDNESLTSIMIPDSVTSIEEGTFYQRTALASITIPDSVTSISSYAFDGCASLTSVIVTPGSYAEQYCKDNELPFTYAEGNQ